MPADLEGASNIGLGADVDIEVVGDATVDIDMPVIDFEEAYRVPLDLNRVRAFENRLSPLERDLAAHSLKARAIEIRFLLTDSGESVTAKVSTAEPIGRAKRRLARETGAPTRAQSEAQKWAFGG